MLDYGRWTLDADHGTLILRTALILCSQSWHVSQRQNDTLIILQTRQFLYYREIPHKETKYNEPLQGVLKKSYSLGQNLTLFYGNNIGCSPMAKDVTYTLL